MTGDRALAIALALTAAVGAAVVVRGVFLMQTDAPELPALLAGLPADETPESFEEGSAMFDARVGAAFPPGTPAGTVRTWLVADGFTLAVQESVTTARYEAAVRNCNLAWRIVWNESGGAVTSVSGDYSGACF